MSGLRCFVRPPRIFVGRCRMFLASLMISLSVMLGSGAMRLGSVFVMRGRFLMSILWHDQLLFFVDLSAKPDRVSLFLLAWPVILLPAVHPDPSGKWVEDILCPRRLGVGWSPAHNVKAVAPRLHSARNRRNYANKGRERLNSPTPCSVPYIPEGLCRDSINYPSISTWRCAASPVCARNFTCNCLREAFLDARVPLKTTLRFQADCATTREGPIASGDLGPEPHRSLYGVTRTGGPRPSDR